MSEHTDPITVRADRETILQIYLSTFDLPVGFETTPEIFWPCIAIPARRTAAIIDKRALCVEALYLNDQEAADRLLGRPSTRPERIWDCFHPDLETLS